MAIKAVIFDVGGVLLRTETVAPRLALAARYGISEAELYQHVFDSQAAIRATIGEVPESAVWEYVGNRFQLNATDLETFQNEFWAGDRLDEELLNFLGNLRPRLKTALLSNAWDGARQSFTTKGLLAAVDDAVISAEVRLAKPVRRIYELAVERLNVQPAEALFLDDMAQNVTAARAAGMVGVQFRNTAQAIAEIQGYLTAS